MEAHDEPRPGPVDGDPVLAWLLEGDPAVRWQVMRDLQDAPRAEVDAERSRVASEGWGARLLDLQDDDGRWAGALYSPKWTSDVLRGLEHFRASGAAADERLGDAVEVVRRGRRSDGTWPLRRGYPGRTWFRMEAPGPSRWATLRSRRVLEWWDRQR